MLIEIWSDVVCPWCYVGKRRLETALAAFEHRDEVEVVYRSFELDPSRRTEGARARPPGAGHASTARTEPECAQMQRRVDGVAAEEGLDFRLADAAHGTPSTPTGCSTSRWPRAADAAARAEGGAARGVLRARRGRRRPRRAARALAVDGRPRRRPGRARCSATDEYADAVQADIAPGRARTARPASRSSSSTSSSASPAPSPPRCSARCSTRAWARVAPAAAAGPATGEACGPDGCAI